MKPLIRCIVTAKRALTAGILYSNICSCLSFPTAPIAVILANTTQRSKNSFDFTMNWAKADNSLIKDLKDFTATFFQKNTLLKVLLTFSVFDVSDTLLVMRPYQIAATERILWKINSAYQAKNWSHLERGGFIWHTTGLGQDPDQL